MPSITYFHSWNFDLAVVQLVSHSDSLWPHWLKHSRLAYLLLSPRVCSNPCPLSQWCYLTISSSATPFSFYLQSFPASGSFLMSWLFTSGGQSTETSASALPMNIQGLFPLAAVKAEPKSTGSRVFISDCFMVNPVTIHWLVNHSYLTPCLHQMECSFGKKKVNWLKRYLQIYLALAQFKKTIGLSF